jgi:hypothetical protein
MQAGATRVVGLVVAATVSALTLSGCSSAPKATTTSSPPSSAMGSPSLPKTVPDVPRLRRNIRMVKCQAIPRGWEAGGTATNPGHATATYLVTVYFTDTQATVIGYAQTRVEVAPGQTAPWTASSRFAAPTKTRCVLTGVG